MEIEERAEALGSFAADCPLAIQWVQFVDAQHELIVQGEEEVKTFEDQISRGP